MVKYLKPIYFYILNSSKLPPSIKSIFVFIIFSLHFSLLHNFIHLACIFDVFRVYLQRRKLHRKKKCTFDWLLKSSRGVNHLLRYRRGTGISSWAALLWQRRLLSRQPERNRGTPLHPHMHTRHSGRTGGTDPGSPGSDMDWMRPTWWLNRLPLQNALRWQRYNISF